MIDPKQGPFPILRDPRNLRLAVGQRPASRLTLRWWQTGMRRVTARGAYDMDEVKKTYREAEETAKETWRGIDGTSPQDSIKNAGDDIAKHAGNAGDKLRGGVEDLGDDVRRGIDDLGDKVDDAADDARRELADQPTR